MKKAGALASALRSSGCDRCRITPAGANAGAQSPSPGTCGPHSHRAGHKAITVHFPEDVRRQLKAMAGEQGRDMDDMVAEGFNLLSPSTASPKSPRAK